MSQEVRKFFQAAIRRDIPLLKSMLRKNPELIKAETLYHHENVLHVLINNYHEKVNKPQKLEEREAVSRKFSETAAFLISRGANVNRRVIYESHTVRTPLEDAIAAHIHESFIATLITEALKKDEVAATRVMESAIFDAVGHGNLPVVKLLMQHGVLTEGLRGCPHDYTLLHVAVINHHPKVLKFLLDNTDIDVNERCKVSGGGKTCLEMVVENTNVNLRQEIEEMATLLITAGATITSITKTLICENHSTALMCLISEHIPE